MPGAIPRISDENALHSQQNGRQLEGSGTRQSPARSNQRMTKATLLIQSTLALALFTGACGSEALLQSKESLGEALFHDTNLSMNRSQACATCHDPDHAFIDPRRNSSGHISAFSLGDDGVSFGGRNAPTAAYARFSPPFHVGVRQRHNRRGNHHTYQGPLGGMFWDGREANLEGQAGGPPLNPIEMGMPGEAAVVQRLQDTPDYVRALRDLYGKHVFDTPDAAYNAFKDSIASFERTEQFAPFDSRYDRALRGDVSLTFKELTGKSVFFSAFASCAICHQLHASGDPVMKFNETFTGYEYQNVGTPGLPGVEADTGLAQNPMFANDPSARGKFKVPTLRNVAVTEPYMHNGVFRDLKTVIEFYDRSVNPQVRAHNPETGAPWADPEIPETVATELLQTAQPLTDAEVEGLVCFLRALTDARYEHLIQDKGIDCAD